MRVLSLLLATLSCAALVRAADDHSRRFFDFTPVSADNPVVATIDGRIGIPLSELRAYRQGERLQATTETLAQKRALLDDLLGEYLLVDEDYRTGVPESEKFSKQMDATRELILTDFMSARAREGKKAGPGDYTDPAGVMADKLYDAATIDISNEAFAIIRRAAAAIDRTSADSNRGPVVDDPQDAAQKLFVIVKSTPEATAVRYGGKSLSVHQILAIYAGLPAPRPQVATQDGFVAMIKPLITPDLMAAEAVRLGIADEQGFREKFVQNRNALLRFHAHGTIEARANDALRAPDLDQKLQAWYQAHGAAYAAPDARGAKKIPAFAEARERALADYSVDLCESFVAEKIGTLRKEHTITIDEKVLGTL